MSDQPKFEVIDRRKMKAEEEKESRDTAEHEPEARKAPAEPAAGPRLVVNESRSETARQPEPPQAEAGALEEELPPPPTAEESHEQKAAYDASAERIEELIRAQNPGVGAQPPMTFESLVQQFYVTAMLQLGAGTQEGQQPRVDIVGARTTIDLLAILAEKTRGNLTAQEDNVLQSALFDARMAFLELSKMISLQSVRPPVKR
ncbi:MAG: DUF1844 domain-containing protein [Terracidiphilus sp.]